METLEERYVIGGKKKKERKIERKTERKRDRALEASGERKVPCRSKVCGSIYQT